MGGRSLGTRRGGRLCRRQSFERSEKGEEERSDGVAMAIKRARVLETILGRKSKIVNNRDLLYSAEPNVAIHCLFISCCVVFIRGKIKHEIRCSLDNVAEISASY